MTHDRPLAPTAPHRLIAVVEPSCLTNPFGEATLRGFYGEVVVLTHGDATVLLEPLASWSDAGVAARRAYGLVDQLWSIGAVLPGGASSIFAGGLSEAQGWIEDRAGDLTTALDRVRGRGEFVVSVETEPAPSEPLNAAKPTSGAAYLRFRAAAIKAEAERSLETRESAEVLGAQISAAIGGAPRLMFDAGTAGVDLCFLAETTVDETLRAEVAAAGVKADVSGPWPPFSFAEAALAEADADAAWSWLDESADAEAGARGSGGAGRSAA